MPEGNTPPASGGSNKMLYIIGGVVVLALVGWFLMRGVGSVAELASGVDVNRSMDGSTTYTDSQGNSATVGSNSMPSNWPSDAPANYAGASIQYSGTSNPQTGKMGSAVSYTVRASAKSVGDYYAGQLASAGWKIEGTANMGGATVVSATKDTRSFGAYIVGTNGGMVTVTAGIEL